MADDRDATNTTSPTSMETQNNSNYINDEGKETIEETEDLKAKDSASDSDVPYVSPSDRVELTKLASIARSKSYASQRDGSFRGDDVNGNDLERKNTIDGLNWGDEVLDPQSGKFDLRKWIRMTLRSANDADVTLMQSGVTWKNVFVSGSGSSLNIQSTVGSLFTSPLRIGQLFKKQPHKTILHGFDGIMKSGELLIVLGRPGSGCSTLLKTLTGELYGLNLEEGSTIHYDGIPQPQMLKEFKGEVIYNGEVDTHFPKLTVGETLQHAAHLRTPQKRPFDLGRKEFAEHITQVVMAVYGLSHTFSTFVGNEYIRGVSGGERKRVSLAEATLSQSRVAAWDNSTRGLDSATALKFIESLRLSADLVGTCHATAVYQASEAMYQLFDKAVVLYEGREIFFGRGDVAKQYFETMGYWCPPRQTTGDFLTSITNPLERQTKEGFENKVPRTANEFEEYWKNSQEFADLQREIADYEKEYPIGDPNELQAFRDYKTEQQSRHVRPKSSYTVSIPMQIRLNMHRAYRRIVNDKASTLTPIATNIIMALIIGSIFYGTPNDTSSFTAKGSVLFFAVLLSALSAINEINSLYEQRPIVEKHKSYAFYHPATEAIAGIVLDIPIKFAQATVFMIILYFLANLRREASNFFIFFLINYTSMFVMSAFFRTLAAITKTVAQAMSLSGIGVLAIVVYTGFTIPVKYQHPWFSWLRWLNPIFYAFESLIANEFHGQNFACSSFVPAYNGLTGDQFVCLQTGANAGQTTVNGDAYIATAYNYYYSHLWRNFGILLAFLFGFMAMYFIAVELNSNTASTAEVLVFRRGHVPSYILNSDEEAEASEKAAETEHQSDGDVQAALEPQTDIFTWRDVSYDIHIKKEERRLLDNVSGYVKPGTLTALMGTSGAGKTTLLDVLAQRTTMGVITGSMFVNGSPLPQSFQRMTGYVQQQDLHLETATVRESLRFSAMLRQPKSVSKAEKYEHVEEVIKMLNMEDFAEAIVGVPGEGLNVEQRKLLTIGVELAAKPKLLLFLDEPTSGLDSQSSWAICAFLRKLADNGQAVLCTIHQPSAILFQEFDRLLFLRKGGQTVYFGNIGEQSRTLLDYFESNGARPCDSEENPAEYMLEIVGDDSKDWVQTWNNSPQAAEVQREIDDIHKKKEGARTTDANDPTANSEFAMPFRQQLYEVTYRVFQQYWRMPSYIMAKMMLSTMSGLFIGFSFYDADSSLQGLQNILYSLFMVTTIFSTLVQQIMPLFVVQRSLYEVRERPSKAYSWKAFMIANIVVEIPYQIIAGVLIFSTFYFPVVGAGQSAERQGLVLLFAVVLLIYASTFGHMCIAALPDAETASAVVTLLFAMLLVFNGVMQPPSQLPGFWIFMYRASSLTYWVSGMASTMLHGRQVVCSSAEVSVFSPPSGTTCGEYLQPYLQQAPGYLLDPSSTTSCEYCQLQVADTFLASSNIYWSERWRNFGLVWVYVFFNIAVAVALYWVFRVRPTKKRVSTGKASKKPKQSDEESNDTSDDEPQKETGVTSPLSAAANNYFASNLQRVETNKRNARVF